MKIKTKIKGERQRDLFDYLGLTYQQYENFYPDADWSNSLNSGWQNFLKSPYYTPEIQEKIKEIMENNGMYIEICPPRLFGEILLVASSFLFQKMGLQAEKRIDIERIERRLKQNKEMLEELPKTIGVIPNGCIKRVDENTPLNTLRKIPNNITEYLDSDEETSYPCRRFIILGRTFLFLYPFQKKEIPLPILKWTGNELVAIHTENIPEKLLNSGILKIEHKEAKNEWR